ncbi:MAG: hypothetical protein HY445_01185 [Candidatus Niyogibacteria bacterium]|nr:hypothetical protein [Candidatus Niyogibacteria bacterium]
MPKRAAPLYIYFFLGAIPQDFDDPLQHPQQFLHAPRDAPFFFPGFFIESEKLLTRSTSQKVYHKKRERREKNTFAFFLGFM